MLMTRPGLSFRAIFFVVACIFAMAAAADPVPARPETLPRVAAALQKGEPLRIVAFGSSSTEGVGATTPRMTYPRQLDLALSARVADQVVVLNRGIGGEDAEDMARRIPAILADHPDLVIWQTGSNDPLRAVPLERFEALTRAGITQIRAAGVDVMLMEPQLCERLASTTGADIYRDALRRIGAEMGVPVIKRYDLMTEWLKTGQITRTALLWNDGLHMTDAGYAMLGTEVAREILAATKLAGHATALR